jgi:hypothetical protein
MHPDSTPVGLPWVTGPTDVAERVPAGGPREMSVELSTESPETVNK